MKRYENQTYEEERALYGTEDAEIVQCRFEGAADGESALKESRNIRVEACHCALRYPFWHDQGLILTHTDMTETCRAALWYSKDVQILDCDLNGIKALRECRNVTMRQCRVRSAEFGWKTEHLQMEDSTVESEYFLLEGRNITLKRVNMKGKYSFQYVKNALVEDCVLDTKDAFWHAEHVVVRNCTVRGEYLAWYASDVLFDHCHIIGTQPLCYSRGIVLRNCTMEQTDLAFEKSEVNGTVITPVLSVKNMQSGTVTMPSCGEWIREDPDAKGIIIQTEAR